MGSGRGPGGSPGRRPSIAWPLAIAAWLGASPAAAQSASVLSGTVTSEETGVPLAGASVEFVHPQWTGGTVTATEGTYRIAGVPAGRGLMRVRHVGHQPMELEVLVAPGREIVVDLALGVRPIALDPVRVDGGRTGAAADSLAAPDAAVGRATVRVLDTSPGFSEVGLAEVARGSNGDDPLDPGSVLYVRGAASDLKLVHLDGAPVYAPFPLGGLLDPFAPELLSSAEIYLGGAPARYDGGLSYVMDLRTRGASRSGVRTSGSVDLLSANALAEAGVADRVGVVASVRGMHPLASAAALGDRLPYDYAEGLVRADALLGPRTHFALTGFANDESVWMTDRNPGQQTIEWGNRAGSARLSGWLGNTLAELTAAAGRYEARLPLGPTLGTVADGRATRSRLALDLVGSTSGVTLRYGASIEGQDYRASVGDPIAAAPATTVDAAGTVLGAYGELSLQPLESVSLRGGARIDRFSPAGEVAIAPRLALTWMVTDRAAVSIAAGRYHQFLQPPDEVLLSTGESVAFPASRPLVVGSASHFTAAFEQDLGDGLGIGLEGFYKRFADLPAPVAAESNASGVDLWVRRTAEGISGWFGYSLAWVWASGRQPGEGDFTGRHLLSTGLNLPIDARTSVELRFAYGAGIPYAGIPLHQTGDLAPAAEFNQTAPLRLAERAGTESAPLLFTPDEPFIRVDAALSRRWTRNRDGRPVDLVPFVRVINGLGARDALFYYLDKAAGENEPTALGALPVIPIVGLEWKF